MAHASWKTEIESAMRIKRWEPHRRPAAPKRMIKNGKAMLIRLTGVVS
jgi:hypothetical protein